MAKKWWNKGIERIEDRAWQVIQAYKRQYVSIGEPIPDMPPVPVFDIASLFVGLDVEPITNLQYQGQKLSGLLEPDIRLISYESQDIPGRQAFSVAHEIGHYYLHYQDYVQRESMPTLFNLDEYTEGAITRQSYFRCSHKDINLNHKYGPLGEEEQAKLQSSIRAEQIRIKRETEANWFASALLMPEPYVQELMRCSHNAPHQLAEYLGVSKLAAEVRLVRLGYIKHLSHEPHPADPTQTRFL